jgi:hypothetical protein
VFIDYSICFLLFRLAGGGYFYDGYCIETDRYLYEHDDFLVLFAAGNDGGTYQTIVSPSLSKNAISIGCSENPRQERSGNVNNVVSGCSDVLFYVSIAVTFLLLIAMNMVINMGVHSYFVHIFLRSQASFSSLGPTHDGRYKPDLVAPGMV